MDAVTPPKLSLMDAMFLAGETRESMMHVGALFQFTPPADAPADYLRTLAEQLRDSAEVQPPWNIRLKNPEMLADPRQNWVTDDQFDMDYHFRRSALPGPGGARELGILVSRLHSGQIDFHRPPWEFHIIEGLRDGDFALYGKIHHALVDGYTGMRMIAASLSDDADDRTPPRLFSSRPPARTPSPGGGAVPTFGALLQLARNQIGVTRNVGRALLNVVGAVREGDRRLLAPMQAPRTIFNGRISRNRRFATQQFDLAELKALGKKMGGTLNDVVLALCSSALRRHLQALGELPDIPLIAMLPVNIRPKDDPGGGNAVGAILASLATDVADPVERLRAIIDSTGRAKEQLEGMSKSAILQYSALLMTPLGLQMLTGTSGRTRPAFNVVISNVPGPTKPLYFAGARMNALFPLSIPFHGYALNITITGYAGTLNFGFTGCRDALPHLQRLAVYSGEAYDELGKRL